MSSIEISQGGVEIVVKFSPSGYDDCEPSAPVDAALVQLEVAYLEAWVALYALVQRYGLEDRYTRKRDDLPIRVVTGGPE